MIITIDIILLASHFAGELIVNKALFWTFQKKNIHEKTSLKISSWLGHFKTFKK